jgi:hypothetical protein
MSKHIPTRSGRRSTAVGRIVYERPPHYYDEKDFKRIFRAIFKRKPAIDDLNFYLDVIFYIAIEYGVKDREVILKLLGWVKDKAVSLGDAVWKAVVAWVLSNFGGRK